MLCCNASSIGALPVGVGFRKLAHSALQIKEPVQAGRLLKAGMQGFGALKAHAETRMVCVAVFVLVSPCIPVS